MKKAINVLIIFVLTFLIGYNSVKAETYATCQYTGVVSLLPYESSEGNQTTVSITIKNGSINDKDISVTGYAQSNKEYEIYNTVDDISASMFIKDASTKELYCPDELPYIVSKYVDRRSPYYAIYWGKTSDAAGFQHKVDSLKLNERSSQVYNGDNDSESGNNANQNSSTNITIEELDQNCKDFSATLKFLGKLLRIAKVMLPLLIMIKAIYNAFTIVMSGKVSDLSDYFKKMLMSFVAAILVFVIPNVIDIIMGIAIRDTNSDVEICRACIFDPDGSECKNAIESK